VDTSLVQGVLQQVARRVVGQEYMVERLLISLLTGGHVLLEGVPGLAKTLTVRTLAATIHTPFHRIQFSPDLLPADVLGTQVFDQSRGSFTVKKGPIFANIVLADEINRAPAKVQAALLEAMQEKQVTLGGETFFLEEPFLVLATQNPIEQEGTYPLPEAQIDRFMLKLRVGYPSREEEKEIMRRMAGGEPIAVLQVATPKAILDARRHIAEMYMDERIVDYIVDIVLATRAPGEAGMKDLAPLIEFGASPRATIALAQASRAHAFLRGRAYVTPDDVKAIAPDVLRHRVLTTYEAEAEEVTSDDIIKKILATVEAPDESEPEQAQSSELIDSTIHHSRFTIHVIQKVSVPPEVLRQVRLIELRTRRLVNSLFAGEYRSIFKGHGMEFAEVREYLPGDEVRSIDWNVTARMGRPFVKRYIEERELTVMLAVDLSGSSQFGTVSRFKSEMAIELAAVLTMSAVRNNDRVGVLLFTDHVEHVVPPGKGRRHALRIIRDVLVHRPEGRARTSGALGTSTGCCPTAPSSSSSRT
jgi:MoxR-like ATPase